MGSSQARLLVRRIVAVVLELIDLVSHRTTHLVERRKAFDAMVGIANLHRVRHPARSLEFLILLKVRRTNPSHQAFTSHASKESSDSRSHTETSNSTVTLSADILHQTGLVVTVE